ncbi:MAG: 2-hydroxyacyl-CoA dehydratase [Spirochaetes bacterium]|nr:MAG: 2-hydroxyacyl-CoA dehydratase [Spirochaetota bacterium]
MQMEAIFNKVVNDPYAYAKDWKARTGGKVVGYFCSYAPEEIIHAAGALPFRIFGTGKNITLADAHLQAYSCSLVRGGLEEALDGSLSFLEGTVFPHTCDSIQRLSDIWRLNTKFKFHLDVVLPVKLTTDSARDYMKDVMHKFRRDLEKAMGVTITDEKLAASVKLYNAIRARLKEIYELRSGAPWAISGAAMYAVIKAGMMMDRADFLAALEKLAAEVRTKAAAAGKAPKRVMLAGGICNHPNFYGIIEEYGAAVVWDELCTGTRSFEGAIGESAPAVDAIAKRYLDRVVCPAKHNGNTARADNLVSLVKEKKAQGVLFIYLKFCDPQCFDYPYMKEALDKAGVPSMLYEVEEQPQAEGQIRTRFETFIDML